MRVYISYTGSRIIWSIIGLHLYLQTNFDHFSKLTHDLQSISTTAQAGSLAYYSNLVGGVLF